MKAYQLVLGGISLVLGGIVYMFGFTKIVLANAGVTIYPAGFLIILGAVLVFNSVKPETQNARDPGYYS